LNRAAPKRRHRPAPDAPLSIESLDTRWSVEVRGDSGALRRRLRAAVRGRSGAAPSRDGVLRVRIGPADASFAPGSRLTEQGVLHATPSMAVRLSLHGLSGGIQVARSEDAPAALEIFCRAAAMRMAAEGDWVCLHASSALSASSRRLYVFAGPSEVGKTTCARAFGAKQVVDDDFVVLRANRAGFERLTCLPPGIGSRPRLRHLAGPCPVAAIIFPGRAERFALTRLRGADALRRCLHLPAVLPRQSTGKFLDAVHRLVETVPVFRLAWKKGQNLPQLLDGAMIL
jgi:hypothetical protein